LSYYVRLVFMRSWERKDITDILIKHHEELREASVELSDGGSSCQEAGLELDDDCIVIEEFLESTFGLQWAGAEWLVNVAEPLCNPEWEPYSEKSLQILKINPEK